MLGWHYGNNMADRRARTFPNYQRLKSKTTTTAKFTCTAFLDRNKEEKTWEQNKFTRLSCVCTHQLHTLASSTVMSVYHFLNDTNTTSVYMPAVRLTSSFRKNWIPSEYSDWSADVTYSDRSWSLRDSASAYWLVSVTKLSSIIVYCVSQ